MRTVHRVFQNLYRDSVSLMQVSARVTAQPGIYQASAVMATEANLAMLHDTGLLDDAPCAAPNDLLVAVAGEDDALDDALAEFEKSLAGPVVDTPSEHGAPVTLPRSLAMAAGSFEDANLALISVPGTYAAAEAWKALGLGLNVMLFSDNVSVADEIALKTYARDEGLIVMGPDCGTAIIDGIPLGFANVVRRGDIGVVGASGTGLQQVTCLVDRAGAGISQAMGTGGRDLGSEIGGIAMLQAISLLGSDDETRVIVVLSKPPAPEIAERVVSHAAATGKPVVVNFLGADPASLIRGEVSVAATLADAASLALDLRGGQRIEPRFATTIEPAHSPFPSGERRFMRGLYSGGTFCYEALVLLTGIIGPVFSNTPLAPDHALEDPWVSRDHTVIDLGEDFFTRGRPHPMIDQGLRNERMLQESRDPETAVILFDVILGFGAHSDPAPGIVATVREARAAVPDGPAFVASVCGTDGDPQNLSRQESVLRDAGVLLADNNAAAVRLAASIIHQRGD